MSSHVINANKGSFAKHVLESDVPVLVDFSATWCGPCKLLEPVVHGLAETYAGRARVDHAPTAALNSSSRSSCSQGNAGRPKWPYAAVCR